MKTFTWTTTHEIQAETEEESFLLLIEIDTGSFLWEPTDNPYPQPEDPT